MDLAVALALSTAMRTPTIGQKAVADSCEASSVANTAFQTSYRPPRDVSHLICVIGSQHAAGREGRDATETTFTKK